MKGMSVDSVSQRNTVYAILLKSVSFVPSVPTGAIRNAQSLHSCRYIIWKCGPLFALLLFCSTSPSLPEWPVYTFHFSWSWHLAVQHYSRLIPWFTVEHKSGTDKRVHSASDDFISCFPAPFVISGCFFLVGTGAFSCCFHAENLCGSTSLLLFFLSFPQTCLSACFQRLGISTLCCDMCTLDMALFSDFLSLAIFRKLSDN